MENLKNSNHTNEKIFSGPDLLAPFYGSHGARFRPITKPSETNKEQAPETAERSFKDSINKEPRTR